MQNPECRNVQGQLQDYVDGQLSAAARRACAAHLDGCSDCRAEWRLLALVSEALADWPLQAEPADFNATVMARVRERAPHHAPARQGWFRLPWQEAVLVASLLGAFVLLWLVYTHLQAEQLFELKIIFHRAKVVWLSGLYPLIRALQRQPDYIVGLSSILVAWAALMALLSDFLLGDYARR
jgi:predicted anti-sigma-YlaC factor YlaD